MNTWEYLAVNIELEFGTGREWTARDTPYGETKLQFHLDEFGKLGWELASMMPVLSEQGIPIVPISVYAIFKREKK
jgi:hypothetical protein